MKKALKLLLVIFTLSTLILLKPFSISANTALSAPFLGVNVNILAVTSSSEKTNIGTINFTPNSNVMTVSGQLNCQTYYTDTGGCKVYQAVTSGTQALKITTNLSAKITSNNTLNTTNNLVYLIEYEFVFDNHYIGSFDITDGGTVYVNGTSVKITNGPYSNTDAQYPNIPDSSELSISSYNLTVADSNKMYWQFPIESYPAIQYLYNQGFEQVGMNDNNNYLYPIFQKNTTGYLDNNTVGSNGLHMVIMFTTNSVSGQSGFNTHYKYNSNFSIDKYENLRASASGYIVKVTFVNNGTSNQQLQLQCNNNNGKFFVIFYSNVANVYNVSEDFALLYRLNTGTPESNQSVRTADSTNQTLGNKVNQEENLVSNAENTLSQDLNTLDITNKNNDLLFNQKFIKSAIWVRDRFNYMTNNNAYGYMITFAMVIGLALVIIGKLRG